MLSALLTSPMWGRGSSNHRVCVSVCLPVTVLAGAAVLLDERDQGIKRKRST